MQFLIVKEQEDGKIIHKVVEGESPQEVMMKEGMQWFLSEKKGLHSADTIGVYEIGTYNHLTDIVANAEYVMQLNKQIHELEGDKNE